MPLQPRLIRLESEANRTVNETTPLEYNGYKLDSFQQRAIAEIESGNSVIVAAPTGAGKTLIAEYLIEKHLLEGSNIIFTAPIKAITSQKYRDFSERFPGHVGILTGDVVINRDAQVLMMTTEIYRNMLLEGSDFINRVNYVIFDEVHYLSDIERGTVWEESIIFSPDRMRYLCLSATVPNSDELASWISSIKNHRATVIRHNNRPVPLSHYLFIPEARTDIPAERAEEIDTFRESDSGNQNRKRGGRGRRRPSYHLDLIRHVTARGHVPLIFFLFSRAKCFDYAKETARHLDFTTASEKRQIGEIFDDIVRDPTVRALFRTSRMREFLIRGIGVHNAGLFPLLKEAVEVLFCRNLLKVVFCTETFALGINMPARAVAFESLEKYDGIDFRMLKTREYYQMAGRAGRRGLDTAGFVYSIVNPGVTDPEAVKALIFGNVEPLESQFNLSYNTVLNLLKLGQPEKIKHVLKDNFGQYQLDGRIVALRREMEILTAWREGNFCVRGRNIPCREFGKYLKHRKKVLQWFQDVTTEAGRYGGKKLQQKLRKKHSHQLKQKLEIQPCATCPRFEECRVDYDTRYTTLRRLRKVVGSYSERVHQDQYDRSMDFLRELGYIDENMTLTARGELASTIHGYEIVVTELFFAGLFESLAPEELCALITAVVFERRKNDLVNLKIIPGSLFRKFLAIGKEVEELRGIESRHKLSNVKSLDFTMSPIAYFWATEGEFSEIFEYTNLEEGDVIRTLRRAMDLLRQVETSIPDLPALKEKIRSAIRLVKRSVVDPEQDY
ncbi:MAG: hypothetical protein CVV64_05990 [Candidatus Wallbacteria bacterium HGW-Wallbacteria-1]|jgi:superfamily II RNA helicase|uniref:DEAD/DEAH box helicase n=1 Tax=Candidatus Wallbacteria bacterium HGW-Wallbacteria-1 TaxID=2013854 RepID=A0A2N1PSK3_9BACT|nr:MAG: hypothetical protein CVV64_05990 [Candidatus Wallbacteria bacterium HGW-Wallbacteria-1]